MGKANCICWSATALQPCVSVNLVVGIQEIPYAVKSELNYLEWYNFLRAMNINSPALTTILAPPYVEIVLPLHIMFLKDCLSSSLLNNMGKVWHQAAPNSVEKMVDQTYRVKVLVFTFSVLSQVAKVKVEISITQKRVCVCVCVCLCVCVCGQGVSMPMYDYQVVGLVKTPTTPPENETHTHTHTHIHTPKTKTTKSWVREWQNYSILYLKILGWISTFLSQLSVLLGGLQI